MLSSILEPAATAVWLFLRLFVLSIGQEVYWWGAVCLALAVMIFRLARSRAPRYPSITAVTCTPRNQAALWHSQLRRGLEAASAGGGDGFRRDLMWLFTEMYASQGHGALNYKIRDELLDRRIPLPEGIHSFLYAEKPAQPKPSLFRHPVLSVRWSLRAASEALRAWIRRKTGRARSEYIASVEEVVKFMEDSLEMTHDDTTLPAPHRS